jgi:hypothetical protein
MLVQWAGTPTLTGGFSTDQILQLVPCDVVLLSGLGWESDGPVLLSLRGGANLSLGVEVARALAGQSSITLFHAAENRRGAPAAQPKGFCARRQDIKRLCWGRVFSK